MGRNHVHFATGPTLESVLPLHTDGTSHTVEGLKSLGLDDGRVISGMEHVDRIARGEPPQNPDRMIRVRVAADIAQDQQTGGNT